MLELKQDRRAERLLCGEGREGEGTRYVQWISGFLAYWVFVYFVGFTFRAKLEHPDQLCPWGHLVILPDEECMQRS